MAARGFTVLCVLASWLATPAYADGVCEKGFRDTTAAERATMTSVLQAAKSALPTAPEGWVIGGYEEISVVTNICMDQEATPWSYNISRTFNRIDDAAEREQIEADAGAALRARMAEIQPRIDAGIAKSQELGAQLAAAAEKRDQARIDAIQAEMEKLQKEMQALFDEGPSTEQVAALGVLMTQDRVMTIGVSVNPGGLHDPDLQSAPPPAGAQAAFRGDVTNDGVPSARAVVLLGAWQARSGGGMQSGRRGTVSSAAAHGIAITVETDPARLDTLLAAIDFGAIAALVR